MSKRYLLTDIEIKIHDARRQIEALMDKFKYGQQITKSDLNLLQRHLAEAHTMSVNCYLQATRGIQPFEQVILDGNNVVKFPNKKNNKENNNDFGLDD